MSLKSLSIKELEDNIHFYKVDINYVWDGDTVTAWKVYLGFGITQEFQRGSIGLRLKDVDAPELSNGGKRLRDIIRNLCYNSTCYIRTYGFEQGSFHRYLVDLYVLKAGRIIFINDLIREYVRN